LNSEKRKIRILEHCFWGCFRWTRSLMFGLIWACILCYSAVKLFSKYSNLYVITVPERHGRTDDKLNEVRLISRYVHVCVWNCREWRQWILTIDLDKYYTNRNATHRPNGLRATSVEISYITPSTRSVPYMNLKHKDLRSNRTYALLSVDHINTICRLVTDGCALHNVILEFELRSPNYAFAL